MALILSLYSELMLTMDTRLARKESIRFVVALPGSWLLCSASLKNRSYCTRKDYTNSLTYL
jgi:hypothetical protein